MAKAESAITKFLSMYPNGIYSRRSDEWRGIIIEFVNLCRGSANCQHLLAASRVGAFLLASLNLRHISKRVRSKGCAKAFSALSSSTQMQ